VPNCPFKSAHSGSAALRAATIMSAMTGQGSIVDPLASHRMEDTMPTKQDATANFKVRLRYATVRTRDLDRSMRFYEDVLGLQRTHTKEGEFVQLNAGGAELCVDLSQGERAETAVEPPLIFAVDDLAALCRHFQERGIAIVERGPDNRYVIVRDPDGHPIAFEH
jgi:lactoylglutathione lyase